MSATYYGTFPVKKVTSYGPQGLGVLVSTASIVAPTASISSYVPAINSVYEFDANLWVTNAEVDFKDNGLAEVKITAAGPSLQPSTTIEYQPGGPFIYGLSGTGTRKVFPNYSPTGGIVIKVTFVDKVANEKQIIETYLRKPMPAYVNGIALPDPGVSPGEWDEFPHTCNYSNGQSIIMNLVRGSYDGFVCKDVTINRMGSAIQASLFFKESGKLLFNHNPCVLNQTVALTEMFNY